jgi:hypothetical protein
MTRIFVYEFEEDKPNSLSYEVNVEEDERLESLVEGGAPILYMNRSAMLTMAKLLIKMAHGEHAEHFHIHLKKDFGEGPDVVTIMLYEGPKARDKADGTS